MVVAVSEMAWAAAAKIFPITSPGLSSERSPLYSNSSSPSGPGRKSAFSSG